MSLSCGGQARLPHPMKTTYRTRYGSPDILEIRDSPVPEPGPNELLVRVHAATVSRTDCALLEGRPYVLRFVAGWPRPRSTATGTDFAGVVEAADSGATRFDVGERVMGFDDGGVASHAEYLVLGPRQAATRVPDGVALGVAAASMEGAHYARNMMNKVPLAAGDDVLVYGATGAIGSAAVALLHDAGAVVTAVCRQRHHAAVLGLGAVRVLDYENPGWLDQLGDGSVRYVFDAVGKRTRSAFLRVLRPDGVYISSELGPWGQNPIFAAAAPIMRGPKVRFPVPSDVPASLELASRLLTEGRFSPLIDRHYVLDDVREAFGYADSGRKVGNVLLDLAAG